MAQGGPVAPPAGLRAATSLLRYGSSQPAFCSSDTEAAALPVAACAVLPGAAEGA